MARQRFAGTGPGFLYSIDPTGHYVRPANLSFVIYTNYSCTVLANISSTQNGSPLPGSVVYANFLTGRFAEFWGPTDGTDTLYARGVGATGEPTTLYANFDDRLDQIQVGATPTGPAGGVLSGTYPNPGFVVDMATQAELDSAQGATSAAAQTYADSAVETHRADTTNVHGVADTTALVLTGDSRLTNSRPPSGTAGGVLAGAYPNPAFAADMATQAELDATVASAAATFVPLTQRGATNGVATLDGAGKLVGSQVPSIAITDTTPVSSQVEMLALTAQRGDVAVRTDLSPAETFMLAADDPTVLANWVQITTAGAVLSVAGRSGVVTLVESDISGLVTDLANRQPLDSDLTAIALLTTTTFGRALLTQADAAATRTTLGLGTAATAAKVAAGQAGVLDATDPTTTNGRAPVGAAGGVLSGTYPSPGFAVDMATQAELDAEATARSSADATLQPLDSDLTAIAALTTTPYGRALLTQADSVATRATLGLGTAAVANKVAAGAAGVLDATDPTTTNGRAPVGAAGGVLSGTYPNPGFAVDMATQAELDALKTLVPVVWAEDYGAVGDDATNCTAAFQAAIDAGVAAAISSGQYAAVVRTRGTGPYVVSSARVTTAQGGLWLGNAQIRIPWVAANSPKITLLFDGPGENGHSDIAGQSVKQVGGGTIVRSTLTGATWDATNGWPSVIGGPRGTGFTNVCAIFRNWTIRQPDNPCLAGIDLRYVAQAGFINVKADTNVILGVSGAGGAGGSVSAPTHPTGVGGILPSANNNALAAVRGFISYGHYGGLGINEHADVVDVSMFRNIAALFTYAPYYHTAVVRGPKTEWCAYDLAHIDPTTGVQSPPAPGTDQGYPIEITGWQIENAPSTADAYCRTAWMVLDSNNRYRGRVSASSVLGSFGIERGGPRLSGAKGLTWVDLSAGPAIVVDNGPGTVSATVLSNALTGHPWTAHSGLWGRTVAGQIYQSSAVAGVYTVSVNANVSDAVVSADVTLATARADIYLLARVLDDNNFLLLELFAGAAGDQCNIFKRVGGTFTNLASSAFNTGIVTLGNTYAAALHVDGTTITAYINGVQILRANDGAHSGNTRYGLASAPSASGAGDDGTSRFTNFKVTR